MYANRLQNIIKFIFVKWFLVLTTVICIGADSLNDLLSDLPTEKSW